MNSRGMTTVDIEDVLETSLAVIVISFVFMMAVAGIALPIVLAATYDSPWWLFLTIFTAPVFWGGSAAIARWLTLKFDLRF